ncbi:hypothetical protein D9M68_615770 [compost metagenome]
MKKRFAWAEIGVLLLLGLSPLIQAKPPASGPESALHTPMDIAASTCARDNQ